MNVAPGPVRRGAGRGRRSRARRTPPASRGAARGRRTPAPARVRLRRAPGRRARRRPRRWRCPRAPAARTRWPPTGRGRCASASSSVRRPGEVHLERERAATARLPVGRDDLAQSREGLVDGHQPVGPGGHPGRALDRDGRADEQRHRVGPLPHLGPVDRHEAVVADLSPASSARITVDALLEPPRPASPCPASRHP